MTWPEDEVLEIKVEAGGLEPGFTWTNITDYVYKESIRITRGSADESSRTQPSTCSFLLNNLDGRFSPRNPHGPYYGLLKRNTPLLVSVMGGDPYLDVPASGDARVTDTAQLDITGDIDIRVDATLYNWLVNIDDNELVELAAKRGNVGDDQNSWMLGADDQGGLIFMWSEDGTEPDSDHIVLSTVSMSPTPHGRLAVRVTVDVDDGAGGHVVRFYTAPDINGPWTQLGEDVADFVGTTSIFNSTAPVRVGDSWGNIAWTRPKGKFWAFQLYDGINGTLAAGIDFTAQTVGDTQFTGDAGETWDVTGGASINNQMNRFRGEVTAWPSRWETGGFDAWVTLEAKSLLRRYNQGKGNLRSALARRIPSDSNVVAYWPMEDGETATRFGALTPGTLPMTFTGDVTPAQHAGPDGSDSLPSFGGGGDWYAPVPGVGQSVSGAAVEWIVNLQQVTTTERTIMFVLTSGTITAWRFLVDSTTARLIGTNSSGTELINNEYLLDINGEHLNKWVRWRLVLEQDGANVDLTITWIPIGGAGLLATDSYLGTCGRITALSGPGGISSDIDGLSWGHATVFGDAIAAADDPLNSTDHGFTDEQADSRFERLATEESAPYIIYGARDQMTTMGAQRPDKLIDLLEECAAADFGIFSDSRDDADDSSVVLIGRTSLYNDSPRLILDYEGDGEVHAPLDPTDDDLYVTNSVTATRERGSSAYAARLTSAEGANSVEEVGEYSTEVTVNIADDSRLPDIAHWQLHLGTWDEERYPTVKVRLQAAPHLIGDASQVNIGSRIMIRNARDDTNRRWIPPGDIILQVRGYRETLSQYEWEIEFQCVPARPYDVVQLEAPLSLERRVDTGGSELLGDITSTDATLVLWSESDPTWTEDPQDFPFRLSTGGEEVRVTGPGALINDNPFFDENATGWSDQNATIARDTTWVHPDPSAIASLMVTPDAGGSANALGTMTPVGSVQPGGRYTMSAWVYSPDGYTDIHPAINWHTSAAAYISTGSGSVTAIPAGEWTYITATLTAPATASRAVPLVVQADTPAITDEYWIWNARLCRVSASVVYDEFGRTDTDTWTTADSTQTWTNSGGVAGDYDVLSGYGRHINQAASTGHHSVIASDETDTDVYADITTEALSTGASQFAGVLARYADANNLYEARLEFTTGNVITLSVRKRVAGVETQLDSYSLNPAHVANDYVRVRFRVEGDSLKAKAWLAATEVEPGRWLIDETDSDLTTAGSIGVKSVRNAGNTNANAAFRFDNFHTAQQVFTVTRSRNGVVKAQDDETSASLSEPAIVTL